MDPAVVRALHDAFKRALYDPAMLEVMQQLNQQPAYRDSQEYREWARATYAKEKSLIEALGLMAKETEHPPPWPGGALPACPNIPDCPLKQMRNPCLLSPSAPHHNARLSDRARLRGPAPCDGVSTWQAMKGIIRAGMAGRGPPRPSWTRGSGRPTSLTLGVSWAWACGDGDRGARGAGSGPGAECRALGIHLPHAIYQEVPFPGRTARGASIAYPNDPVNTGHALLILQEAGLITLKPDAGVKATLRDVTANPRKLRFRELEGSIVARALDDVDAAVIYPGFVAVAGVKPESALYAEKDSARYAIRWVTRPENAQDPRLLKFIASTQGSEEVARHAATPLPRPDRLPLAGTGGLTHDQADPAQRLRHEYRRAHRPRLLGPSARPIAQLPRPGLLGRAGGHPGTRQVRRPVPGRHAGRGGRPGKRSRHHAARSGAGADERSHAAGFAMPTPPGIMGFGVTANLSHALLPYLFARSHVHADHSDARPHRLDTSSPATGTAPPARSARPWPRARRPPYAMARRIHWKRALTLWEGSWDDDAVRVGPRAPRVHRSRQGARAAPTKGPTTATRGAPLWGGGPNLRPQRTPVLYQAGAPAGDSALPPPQRNAVCSERGAQPAVCDIVAALRKAAQGAGRHRDDIKVFAMATVIVGQTDAQALGKARRIRALCQPHGRAGPLRQPGSYRLLAPWSGRADTGPIHAGHPNPARFHHHAQRANLDGAQTAGTDAERLPPAAHRGHPKPWPTRLAPWSARRDIDGFNLTRLVAHESLRDFVDLVVPRACNRRGALSKNLRARHAAREAVRARRPPPASHSGGPPRAAAGRLTQREKTRPRPGMARAAPLPRPRAKSAAGRRFLLDWLPTPPPAFMAAPPMPQEASPSAANIAKDVAGRQSWRTRLAARRPPARGSAGPPAPTKVSAQDPAPRC
ncbi:hypothetical protein FQR65_LT20769 [Abscondita terminalis]|nr:hypothetical protein FQR65_LT20769 [Abscondita terminalis]